VRSRPTSAFGAFSALVLWGFWSSYYGNPFAMAPRESSIGLVRGAVFMSYTLLGSTVFACLYGLAVLYRRTPALHARFMVSCSGSAYKLTPLAIAAMRKVPR
jgi:hypothetical protein